MRKIMTAALAATMVAACGEGSGGPAAPASEELLLAQQAQVIARDVAASTQTTYEDWLRRLFTALRDTDDPEARACLAEARELRHAARAAYEAGDLQAARQLLRASFFKVLCAVVEVFPDAAERTGAAVDQAISRIEARLGDRDAPRIRAILARVTELRVRADEALAAGDDVEALAVNLRAIQILHRLVEHIRDGHPDHDAVADDQMHDADV
ncbi:MAG: hypothetical protein ACREME_04915 [Gemmatimonadales bacterium]